MPPSRSSVAWNFFVDKGNDKAECTICKASLSYKSTISNLIKHLKKKHKDIPLKTRIKSPLNDSNEEIVVSFELVDESTNVTENLSIITENSPSPIDLTPQIVEVAIPKKESVQSTTTISATEETSPSSFTLLSAGSSVLAQVVNMNSSLMQADDEERKIEIDNLIMDLFIVDLQPFRMIKDKAFSNLINYTFPRYTIPSKRFFANVLLRGRYESLRAIKMKEIRNTAKSVCVTTDMWTSRKNNSYMAITAHYIDDEFNLKSVLLECVLLYGSVRTSENLAVELKRVMNRWKLSDKILLGVSDDDEIEMKKAFEQNLEWTHYSCYAHLFNSVVQSALKSSDEINVILDKIRTIAVYYRKGKPAWRKLKSHQEKKGKLTRPPLLDNKLRWISTFYMLRRMLVIKEEVNSLLQSSRKTKVSYVTNLEWQLCEHLYCVLKPCEEVIQNISAEKSVAGSIVIPIITGLTKRIETLEHASLLSVAEKFRRQLLLAINKHFSSLTNSRIFTLCMLLDPRFKLYFEDTNIAESTTKHAINLVTELMKEEEKDDDAAALRTIESKCTTTKNALQNVVGNNMSSSVWHHYNEKMQHLRPKSSCRGRATIEVQRYLDDKVILVHEISSPLDWWREHHMIYPFLGKVAQRMLNVVATCITCKRVFSAAGRNLCDRRRILEASSVRELMFLHHNS